MLTERRESSRQLPDVRLDPVVQMTGDEARKVSGKRAHVGRDRHTVVVQHDDEFTSGRAGVVEPLEREPPGHRAISDHRDHPVVLTDQVPGGRDPQRRGDRRARVPRTERIVHALRPLREPADTSVLAQRRKTLTTSSDQLMYVRLMSDIPYELIVRGVEDVVQRQRQLHRPHTRREMSPVPRDHVRDTFPDLLSQFRKLPDLQAAKILRRIDRIQDSRHRRCSSECLHHVKTIFHSSHAPMPPCHPSLFQHIQPERTVVLGHQLLHPRPGPIENAPA